MRFPCLHHPAPEETIFVGHRATKYDGVGVNFSISSHSIHIIHSKNSYPRHHDEVQSRTSVCGLTWVNKLLHVTCRVQGSFPALLAANLGQKALHGARGFFMTTVGESVRTAPSASPSVRVLGLPGACERQPGGTSSRALAMRRRRRSREL